MFGATDRGGWEPLRCRALPLVGLDREVSPPCPGEASAKTDSVADSDTQRAKSAILRGLTLKPPIVFMSADAALSVLPRVGAV